MRSRKTRAGLSFFAVLAWSTSASAQAPLLPVPSGPAPLAPAIVAEQPPMVRYVAPIPADPGPGMRGSGGPLNRHGYGCASHLDWYGCGGLRAQCNFMFGSCRTFFGEPCVPKPPDGERLGRTDDGASQRSGRLFSRIFSNAGCASCQSPAAVLNNNP